ncbi:MAG: glycoside hydrolase family 32 protein, partial [Bacteroidota bacterium]
MKATIYLLTTLNILLVCCQAPKTTVAETDSHDYYRESHRPQFHFSPDSMWMNDPNGMVYHEGEYHLCYQYYPNNTVWGPMHWGHAVSEDMLHWEHLPIALYPDSLGLIFSGSAVIDHGNTSGLGIDGKAPMVAIFTHHNMEGEKAGEIDFQTQSIAYSNDNGRTWTKYEGNPVIANP